MFTFIDLFAGIGGIRIAFERVGGRCVFSSEWDVKAQETYYANFGEKPAGDIREVHDQIPEHDILLAGFPCQPFSIAGVSKKKSLGQAHGFADETQGTLFFEIAKIIHNKKPKAFFLENVKNLKLVFSDEEYKSLAEGRLELIREIGGHVSSIKAKVKEMIEARKVANIVETEEEKTYAYEKTVRPYLDDIRTHIDKLELIVDNELWPLPKYRELLFVK